MANLAQPYPAVDPLSGESSNEQGAEKPLKKSHGEPTDGATTLRSQLDIREMLSDKGFQKVVLTP